MQIMTDTQRAELIEQLERERGTTLDKIAEFQVLVQPISPDNAIGRVSRMDAISNKAINERALHQARERLTRLENTLKRATSPEFGLCMRCRSTIPIPRLVAIPGTVVCVECAST